MSADADAAGPLALLARAHRDPALVRLEGVHALKHALRFGARPRVVASPDPAALLRLLAALAPDLEPPAAVLAVDPGRWAALTSGRGLPSPSLAVADRPAVTVDDVMTAPGRVVVLDRPRHLGNLGAVVRVAAAAGAGGVLVVGDADPWHPTAVRAAAGLQLAVPVARADALPDVGARPVVALDPGGDPLDRAPLPADAVLLLGTERGGLDPALAARAGRRVALPMRAGVSSLNLATAVAAVLYGAPGAPR